ncbi:hypothetical protein ACFOPN_12365 [Xanthomonas hyacinthi]
MTVTAEKVDHGAISDAQTWFSKRCSRYESGKPNSESILTKHFKISICA